VRAVIERAGELPLGEIARSVLIVLAVIIAARFIWVFPATYLPRWLIPGLARRDPSPPWQWPVLLSFVGVRGVVSLAAALAIPLTTADGAAFPYRDQILIITFGVILITLVGLGLLLPPVVRWLGLTRARASEHRREHEAELAARWEALEVARSRIEALAANGNIPPEVMATLRSQHDYRTGRLPRSLTEGVEIAHLTADLRSEMINTEREFVYQMLKEGRITDESRRRIERELDLEEAIIASKTQGAPEQPL
jgi:monovalent cation/hydrogen antiporter